MTLLTKQIQQQIPSPVFIHFFIYGQAKNVKICSKRIRHVFLLITYMKKLIDSDWLRAVQLKSSISAKSVIPVQKA